MCARVCVRAKRANISTFVNVRLLCAYAYVPIRMSVCMCVMHFRGEGPEVEAECIPWPGIQGSMSVSHWNPKQTLKGSRLAWLKLTNHPEAPARPRAANR